MSKLYRPLFVREPKMVPLRTAVEDWQRVACMCDGTASPDYIVQLSGIIVERARKLSTESDLEFSAVAGFLLERSRMWLFEGLPVSQVEARLPADLHALGMLKLAEGTPLSDYERHAVTKKRIIH